MALTESVAIEFAKINGAMSKLKLELEKLGEEQGVAENTIRTNYNSRAMYDELEVVRSNYKKFKDAKHILIKSLKEELKTLLGV